MTKAERKRTGAKRSAAGKPSDVEPDAGATSHRSFMSLGIMDTGALIPDGPFEVTATSGKRVRLLKMKSGEIRLNLSSSDWELVRAKIAAIEAVASARRPARGVAIGDIPVARAAAVSDLADAMTPTQVPTPAMVLQAQRSAAQREQFMSEVGVYTASQLGRMVGSKASNRSAAAGRLSAQGKVFSVPVGGRAQYPAFQLDRDGQPRPVVADVLAVMPSDSSPWFRALWWSAANPHLDDRRPLDLLDSDEEPRIIQAAGRLSESLVL